MKQFLKLTLIALLPFFLVNGTLNAQEKSEAYADYQLIFGKNDSDFEKSEIPSEFMDSDYVVIGQKTYLNLDRESRFSILGLTRKRVKILTDNGLTAFNEIYFQKGMDIDIKIIKQSGEIVQVDPSGSIEVDRNVPKIYQNQFYNESYVKIAVPNLEKGDIIDFIEEYDFYNEELVIEVFNSISSEVPVLLEKLVIDTYKSPMNTYFKSYNGAPEFVRQDGKGLNRKGEQSSKINRIVFTNEVPIVKKEEIWSREYENSPFYKLAIVPKEIPYETNNDNHKLYYKSSNVTAGLAEFAIQIRKRYLNNSEIKKMDIDMQVETILNGVRFGIMLGIYVVSPDIWEFSRDYRALPGPIFNGIFCNLLDKYDIPFEPVVALNNYYNSDDKDIFTHQEMRVGTYIPALKKYYWMVDSYSFPSELPSSFQGSTIYRYKNSTLSNEKNFISKEKLPFLGPESNLYQVISNISIENNQDLVYNQSHNFTGYYKIRNTSRFLYNTDYVLDIYENRGIKDINVLDDYNVASKAGEFTGKFKRPYEAYQDNEVKKLENLKKWYEEFNITELENYKVHDIGMFSNKDSLKVSANYRADNCLKRAGKNILIPFQQMIGENVKLEEKDLKERTETAYLDHTKNIVNNITLAIPEGYKLVNADEFNVTVDNDIASFKCSIELLGNKAIITSTKVYKQAIVKPENFSKLAEMVTLCYDLSKKNLVLSEI